ncbi:MAG: hypothetical protein ACOCWG_05570 [bacterium]
MDVRERYAKHMGWGGWPLIDGREITKAEKNLLCDKVITSIARNHNNMDIGSVVRSVEHEFHLEIDADIKKQNPLKKVYLDLKEELVERALSEVAEPVWSLKSESRQFFDGTDNKFVVKHIKDIVLEIPSNFSKLSKKIVPDMYEKFDDNHNSRIPFSDKIIDFDFKDIGKSKINTPVWLDSFLIADMNVTHNYYKHNVDYENSDFFIDSENFDEYMKNGLKWSFNPIPVERDSKYEMSNTVNYPNDLSRNIEFKVYKRHGKDIYRAVISTHNGSDDRAGYPEPLITKEFGPDTLKMLLGYQISVAVKNEEMQDRGEMSLAKFANECEIVNIDENGRGECIYNDQKYNFALFCEATKHDLSLDSENRMGMA